MIKIPSNDYEALSTYAETNDIDVLSITWVTDTNQYILHLNNRDEMIAIIGNYAEKIDDTTDIEDSAKDEFGFGGDWWK